MPEPRRHHSAPQFLLANFSSGRRKVPQTQVLDKTTSRIFPAAIKDVMVERDFNSIKINGGTASVEHFISRIENSSAPIIEKLVSNETVAGLNRQDYDTIGVCGAAIGLWHRPQSPVFAPDKIVARIT
jgi:hypothetical protein